MSPHSLPSAAVSVRVPATSANCGPGFDSIGLALSLHNQITLQISENDGLSVTGEGEIELLNRPQTIAHQAAHRVFEALDLKIPGVHLTLDNQIPLSRGLGSSSAAIVGGLVAANHWAQKFENRTLSTQELLDLATEIEGHPDNVAPALLGGFVVSAVGEAGKVSAIRVPIARFPRFAVWIPSAELATKAARGVLPESYSRADAVFNLSRAALLVGALVAGDFEALREALRDKIHQDFRAPLVPAFAKISRAAMESGAFGVTLSGSGPSILAWLPENTGAVAAMEQAARNAGVLGRVLELEIEEKGANFSE
jgi:homoserine kinase